MRMVHNATQNISERNRRIIYGINGKTRGATVVAMIATKRVRGTPSLGKSIKEYPPGPYTMRLV